MGTLTRTALAVGLAALAGVAFFLTFTASTPAIGPRDGSAPVPESVLAPTTVGPNHRWGTACAHCMRTRCNHRMPTSCAARKGYLHRHGDQTNVCMCGCCRGQCRFPKNCQAHSSAYAPATGAPTGGSGLGGLLGGSFLAAPGSIVPCLGSPPCIDPTDKFALVVESAMPEQGKLMVEFFNKPANCSGKLYSFQGVYAVLPSADGTSLVTTPLNDPSLACTTTPCTLNANTHTAVLPISHTQPVILVAPIAQNPIMMSGTIWYSELGAYNCRTSMNEQSPKPPISMFEISMDCNRAAFLDTTYMNGLSNTFRVASTQPWQPDGSGKPPGPLSCMPKAPGAAFPDLVWGKDPATQNLALRSPLYPPNPSYDCSKFSGKNLFSCANPPCDPDCFDNVQALQQCPSELANNVCGQHKCRLEMAKYVADPTSYCYWLNTVSGCLGYCWAMAEFDCLDPQCGYTLDRTVADKPLWQNDTVCGQLDSLAKAATSAKPWNKYSCGTEQMAAPGSNRFWWSKPADRGCASSAMNPGRTASVKANEMVKVTVSRPSGAGWVAQPVSDYGICMHDGASCSPATCGCCEVSVAGGFGLYTCAGAAASCECGGAKNTSYARPGWTMKCPYPNSAGVIPNCSPGQNCPPAPSSPGTPVTCPPAPGSTGGLPWPPSSVCP